MSKRSVLFLGVGWMLGFMLDVGKDKFRERFIDPQPKLHLIMNGVRLEDDTVFRFPPMATNINFDIAVQNTGAKAGENLTLNVKLPGKTKERHYFPGWNYTPLSDYVLKNEPLQAHHHYNLVFDRVHKNQIRNISPTPSVSVTNSIGFGTFFTILLPDGTERKHRIHFVRQDGSDTNILFGRAAENYLRYKFPTVHAGKEAMCSHNF